MFNLSDGITERRAARWIGPYRGNVAKPTALGREDGNRGRTGGFGRLAQRLPSFCAMLGTLAVSSCGPALAPCPAATGNAATAVSTAAVTTPPPDTGRERVTPEQAAKIDQIFAAQARPNRPGCAVGVFHRGESIFARGFGSADLEHNVAIDRRTGFDIASMSKQFTALGILLLLRKGKLSLEDDVRKYIPEIPDYGRPIRLRHLLHHTGGLRDYGPLLALAGLNDAVTTREDALMALHRQRALNFVPGTRWEYSNTGYFLLSVVTERITGMPFADFMKLRVLDPLGMKDTRFLDASARVVPNRAIGYAPQEGGPGYRRSMGRWEQLGDSAMLTTIDDLARWDANFYRPIVGDQATIAMMRTPGTLDDGTPLHYALGLFERTIDGRRVEDHAGGTAGFVSQLWRVPDDGLSVACLCNVLGAADTFPLTLAPAVAALFLPGRVDGGLPDAGAGAATGVHSTEGLGGFQGTYYDPDTFEVRNLVLAPDKLVVGDEIEPGGFTREYFLMGPRTFVRRENGATLTLRDATDGSPARIELRQDDDAPQTFVAFRVETAKEAQLPDYVGRYESSEIPRDVEVLAVNGKLSWGTWGRASGRDALVPLARDTFLTSDGGIRFERDAGGRVTGFVAGSDTFRGIRFVRR